MIDVYYTVETEPVVLEFVSGRGRLYWQWSLFHEEEVIAPAAVWEISDSGSVGALIDLINETPLPQSPNLYPIAAIRRYTSPISGR